VSRPWMLPQRRRRLLWLGLPLVGLGLL
jgi:hypothetical protein